MINLNSLQILPSEHFTFEKNEGLIKLFNVSIDKSEFSSWLKIKLPNYLKKGEVYSVKIGTFSVKSTKILVGVSNYDESVTRRFYPREIPRGIGKALYRVEAEDDYVFLNLYFENEFFINEVTIRPESKSTGDNHIYKVVADKAIEIDDYPGIRIDFIGEGSEVYIQEGSNFKNSQIKIVDFSKVIIEKTHPIGINNTKIDFLGMSAHNSLLIKKGTSISGANFYIGSENNLSVVVGEDNMWSTGINVRASDGHQIFDNKFGILKNQARPIVIGDHVWCGANATILKGSVIANGSIIGNSAVVAKKFQENNVAIAGNPGKVVSRDISWLRDLII